MQIKSAVFLPTGGLPSFLSPYLNTISVHHPETLKNKKIFPL
jgi:hypothetical protein